MLFKGQASAQDPIKEQQTAPDRATLILGIIRKRLASGRVPEAAYTVALETPGLRSIVLAAVSVISHVWLFTLLTTGSNPQSIYTQIHSNFVADQIAGLWFVPVKELAGNILIPSGNVANRFRRRTYHSCDNLKSRKRELCNARFRRPLHTAGFHAALRQPFPICACTMPVKQAPRICGLSEHVAVVGANV